MTIDPVTGGGTAERTVKVSRYLAQAGMESFLLTSDIGLNKNLRSSLKDIKLYVLKNLYARYYISNISFKRISKIVEQADIVQLMNHWTAINAAVYRACIQLGKPYVVCPSGALLYYGRSLILKRIYNSLIGKKIIQNANRHIAIPAEEINHFKYYGVRSSSVEIIPNGIDQNDFRSKDTEHFRRKHSLGNEPFILFMGRLNSIKGPDLLLGAFGELHKTFPEYRLVFAGPDGGMEKELKSVARRRAVDHRVHFIGYVGGDEKSQAYHAANILAIPSRQEAMSIVALEAGITGTPVLLTDVCGFQQVSEVRGGVVVKPEATAIRNGLELMLVDRGQLKQSGQRLKAYVLNHFTWDSIILKYISIFESIIANSKNDRLSSMQ